MAYLLGLGKSLPPVAMSQSDAVHHALSIAPSSKKETNAIPVLYRRSGVKSRGLVLLEKKEGKISLPFFPVAQEKNDRGPSTEERMKQFELTVPHLAIEASQKALKNAKTSPARICHLVTVSCTGFSAPGFDVELIKKLKLAPDLSRTQIGFMGCHGAINGFRAARALALAHPGELVLLCAAEISSVHYAYGRKSDHLVANSLFADGAGAAVISDTGASQSWKILAAGSNIFPDSEKMMTWRIGNHGFEMGLSPRLPQLIRDNLKPWLSQWLSAQGFRIEDIRSWAVHPGGPRVLNAVQTSLGLPDNALSVSRQILAEFGNMSSATIFSIIERFYQNPDPLPCLALAFGPGLAAEVVLFG